MRAVCVGHGGLRAGRGQHLARWVLVLSGVRVCHATLMAIDLYFRRDLFGAEEWASAEGANQDLSTLRESVGINEG